MTTPSRHAGALLVTGSSIPLPVEVRDTRLNLAVVATVEERIALAPGTYVISVPMPGGADFSAVVEVEAGRPRTLELDRDGTSGTARPTDRALAAAITFAEEGRLDVARHLLDHLGAELPPVGLALLGFIALRLSDPGTAQRAADLIADPDPDGLALRAALRREGADAWPATGDAVRLAERALELGPPRLTAAARTLVAIARDGEQPMSPRLRELIRRVRRSPADRVLLGGAPERPAAVATVLSQARFGQWLQTREHRLAGLPWMRTENVGGRIVRYVADEILVQDTGSAVAHRTLNGLGHRMSEVAEDEPAAGLRRLRARGLDVLAAVRQLRGQLPFGMAIGANHVFMSAPFEQGGPFGPAVAVERPPTKLAPLSTSARPVDVAILDTGLWMDSPLPVEAYSATRADYEHVIDGQHLGILDSDIGHANFIAGLVVQGTESARVRVVKVMDTFGLCTEADLAAEIDRLAGVSVLSLSLGGYSIADRPPILAAALERFLLGRDRILVAAAGNDGFDDRPFWPAAFAGDQVPWSPQVVAVAAHDGSQLHDWSNRGPWVSVAAPGETVSTFINHPSFPGGWARWSGTSFAVPQVVAAIVERVDAAGSVIAAAGQLRAEASTRPLDGYPAVF
jgi:thermitase